jgi:hypothetical protein
MEKDVAMAEDGWEWDRVYELRVGVDGWCCQICQYWTSDTNLMVEHLFSRHQLAPVYVGIASIYTPA